MAHHVEPMDVDSDFDNKENSLHHSNVLPFTEKGYEELDVSELNMKLRYSITPASSPMSKSYTANCLDNKSVDTEGSANATINENSNLTRSLNSTMTKNDSVVKSLKTLPLQVLNSEKIVDNNRTSVLRPLDSTVSLDDANVTVTISGPSEVDENVSLPSSSSSAVHTPEATTPTNTQKNDGSPIMRGLKSVLNMFRSSQSPIPSTDSESAVKPDILSPVETISKIDDKSQAMLVSTPISTHRKKEASPTKRNSPHKDSSIVFNEDLEKELQWKDETTILFSQERIPIHKLFFQVPQVTSKTVTKEMELPNPDPPENLDSTVEYMDISYNDSIRDKTISDMTVDKLDCTTPGESDGEFVDCETTFTKNESVVNDNDKTPINDKTQELDLTKQIENNKENTSASRLKQIILNTTQDILDATLSITPEDLLPETSSDKINDMADNAAVQEITENKTTAEIKSLKLNETVADIESEVNHEKASVPGVNETVNIVNSLIIPNVEENVNKTIDNTIQPVLDQTIDITKSLINEEKDPNITKTFEIKPTENIIAGNKPTPTEKLDSTLITSASAQIDKMNCDQEEASISTNFNVTNMTPDLQDNNGTDINTAHVVTNQCNSTIDSDTLVGLCPASLKELVDNSLLNTDDKVEPSTVKEASMTVLPIDVPLPDEDDYDKEVNLHVVNKEDTTMLNSLPLDLVDDIKIKSETELIYNTPPEGANVIEENVNNVEKLVVPEVLPTHNPLNFEGGDTLLHQPEIIDCKDEKGVEVVINDAEVMAELVASQDLPDSCDNAPLFNNEVINDEIVETNKVDFDIENSHKAKIDQTLDPPIVPMDVNATAINLKPLPDIINQTITTCSSENPEEVISPKLEQPAVLVEIAANASKDTIEIPSNEIPELLAGANTSVEVDSKNNDVTSTIENMNNDKSINDPVSCPHEIVTDIPECILKESPSQTSPINEIQLQDTDKVSVAEKKNTDEEIVVSENNSPFVSVMAENIIEEPPKLNQEVQVQVEKECHKEGDLVSNPPPSPPIASKGYNFNFDDIDDPFATKTKIRLSPSLDSPTKTVEFKTNTTSVEKPLSRKEADNRRKSHPERKRPIAPKRKLNSTFGGAVNERTVEKPVDELAIGDVKLEVPDVALKPSNVTIEDDKIIHEANLIHKETLNLTKKVLQNEHENENIDDTIEKTISTSDIDSAQAGMVHSKETTTTTSSSEQSTYYSADTSSTESITPKNVFNIPEIDDANFNPFATKSKIRQSPPPSIYGENPFTTKCKIINSTETSQPAYQSDINEDIIKPVMSDDKIDIESMEKDVSSNFSNSTLSSKANDEGNVTTREVNTEDEDTIEGPFLEAEDLNTEDKMSDFDCENIDMMQFNDLPAQGNEENVDSGELFIDAEAFEFLLNQNKSNTVVDSGKESLFLKFDPLFAKRMSAVTSDGVVAALSKIQKRQSTPTKATRSPQKETQSPVAGPSNMNVTQDMDMNISEEFNDELNVTVSKPMMVVPPAVNPVTPRNKSLTPNRSNRRSITFTSPAMAVIDRLLSLSGNSSLVHDTSVPQVSREQNEADIALTQLRELLAEKEIHVYSLRNESKELKERLSNMESHLKNLEEESKDRLKKINELNDRLAEKTKINKSMAAVVEEYERTIASLIAETAQDKKKHAEERIKLINERDEQTAHLASMEVSFSDLHSKYEKSKQVILSCKANEDAYKKSIKEFEENLIKMQTNYELLKQHATSKLNHANQELEKMNRTHEAEVLKLNAMIKRKELHITSLEESLAQKTKANEELTAICDELINKVG